MKPNICICEDGRIAPSCAEAGAEAGAEDCSGIDEDTHSLHANRHSFDVEVHSFITCGAAIQLMWIAFFI